MKRIIALVSLISLLLVNVVSLSGCTMSDDNALKMGQWLALIADSFGMESYQQTTPYFGNVKADDPAFAYFQMAAEWEILEPSAEIDSNTPVTWNDVLITLVNTGGFIDLESTDEEKIEYAISKFDPTIKTYWGNRYIKLKEAIPLLDTAQQMWAGKTFSEKIEQATLSEEVKDYMEKENIVYEVQDNKIIASAEQFVDLQVGDVYTLPNTRTAAASINKVKEIEFVDDKVIITNDSDFTEDDFAQYVTEIQLQDTSALDFGNVVGIYDQYGNTIAYDIGETTSASQMNTSTSNSTVNTLLYNKSQGHISVQTGLFDKLDAPLKFKVKDFDVKLSLKDDDLSVEISKELKKTENRYREQTENIFLKTKFENVELTKDIDYSWGVLHSATVKLDYKSTIEGGIKKSRQTEIGNPVTGDKETKKTLQSTINQYKKALENFNKDVRNSKCREDIYICRLHIVQGGFAAVDFIVKGKISADGELKIVFEIEGAQGIEYKDGKLRYIKSTGIDKDFVADASIEITIAPGIAVTLFSEILIVEVTIDAGLGASVEMKAHLFDAEGHELYYTETIIAGEAAETLASEEEYTTAEEIIAYAESQGGTWNTEDKGASVRLYKGICLEWRLYPILRIELSSDSLICKVLHTSPSIEFLGSDNAFLKGHIDSPNNLLSILKSDSIGGGLSAALGINCECTYDYTPWDNALEEVEDTEDVDENDGIAVTDMIELSTMRLFLAEGEEQHIEITGLPEKYELKDIVAEIEDTDIATFDLKAGTVTGKIAGTTQILVQTKDGKYKAYCAVTVTTEESIEFTELDVT